MLVVVSVGWAAPAPAGSAPLRLRGVRPGGPPQLLRGYPTMISAGSAGGVWYGGEMPGSISEGYGTESVERIDYISPDGRFRDFPFPAVLSGRWPQYLATGAHGWEWFLTAQKGVHAPMLGRVSARGVFSAHVLAVDPRARIRGLAVGGDGELWSTELLRRGRRRLGAILRLSPDGQVAVFRRGLLPGALPESITAGRHGVMWFLDAAGRVGRISPDGAIREFPLGREIVPSMQVSWLSRPILAAAGGDVWFLAGDGLIGQFSVSRGVRFYHPRSSYHGREAEGQRGEIAGLALSADGEPWFTRLSGEVARIDRRGRAITVTNRLIAAYGIAFAGDGRAWVGELPRQEYATGGRETPARMASITPAGRVRQYPPRPACRVLDVIGLGIGLPYGALGDYHSSGLRFCERRVHVGAITIEHGHRRGPLIAVSQTPRPGTPFAGYMRVHIVYARVAPPRRCKRSRYFKLRLATPRLLIWRVLTESPEGEAETFYACARPHGRVHMLTREVSEIGVQSSILTHLQAAGTFIAYISSNGGKDGGSEWLELFDAKTGRTVFSIMANSYNPSVGVELPPQPPTERLAKLGPPVGRSVEAFALDTHGDIAWVGRSEASAIEPSQLVLYLHDRNRLSKLDVAIHIEALAFKGSTLTWVSEGTPHSTSR